MAGDGNFGGGGSVKWSVDIRNAKPANSTITVDHPKKQFRHEGVDDTPRNNAFAVSIRFPESPAARARLAKELQRAASQCENGEAFTLTVPVEGYEPQIRVNWK